MKRKYKIECHDCEKEIHIVDKYEDVELEDLKCCPICGGDNIGVSGNNNE